MLVPMMYFRLDSHFYPFALDWKESSCDRPIVIGTAAYQLDPKEADWPLATIRKQLGFSRTIGAGGQAFSVADMFWKTSSHCMVSLRMISTALLPCHWL